MRYHYVAVRRDPDGLPIAIDRVASPTANPADPRAHCLYSNTSLHQLRACCHAPVHVITMAVFRREQLAAYRTEPSEISAEQYEEALCVMPPLNWARTNGVESFQWRERIVGSVAQFFATAAGKFYRLRDDNVLRPCEIAARINALALTPGD
ncbi:MAG TPA: hypothetical protein VFQ88_15185 [Nevskiaceae bacterium]|nr:hypothetical protein [Nevskiaceae bacterium]